MDYTKIHEWGLAALHMEALKAEDYKKCSEIQKEIDNRIENNTINHGLMQGFRYFDPDKQEFVGDPKFLGMNGLFKNYKYKEDE